MNTKWLNTTEIFDSYERRFAAARAQKRLTRPWEDSDRCRILKKTRKMLALTDDLIPQISDFKEISTEYFDGYCAIQCHFRSWDHFYGAATLYLPDSQEKVPLVFVCCGHGKEGRLTPNYMAMGHRLASIGIAALVMDNIGQGDRNLTPETARAPDHWFSIAPFYCGLTLQGMIVAETLAMIRFMKKDPRFDCNRFGACGNSGGGTLTMFLSALSDDLSVLASSGYPSEINYILSKERRHCACNLLRGSAHAPEMWEIYSLFAPKPLLLEGGMNDILIPMDLAHRNARKVRNTYQQFDAEAAFEFTLTKTGHSWEIEDINRISRFLSQRLLGCTPEDIEKQFVPENVEHCKVTMPEDMLHTDTLAQTLTGITMPDGIELCDIFPPTFNEQAIKPNEIQLDLGRGDVMRVFAQMECSLLDERGE